MKSALSIFGFFCILSMPFSVFAADDMGGIVGMNLGLDFYSRIDDAGDTLAKQILRRNMDEKGTYGALGCNARWLSSERIDTATLDDLRLGNSATLQNLAKAKNAILTTDALSSLSQCLVEKYDALQRAAYQDQNTLEIAGNIGLYMDGDVNNSDYDLLTDITKINAIIFAEKYDYKGVKNGSAKSLSKMLAGVPIPDMFQGSDTQAVSIKDPITGSTTASGQKTTDIAVASQKNTIIPPWAGVCTPGSKGSGATSSSLNDALISGNFLDDIGSVLAGGDKDSGASYVPDTTLDTGSDGAPDTSSPPAGGGGFFDTPKCAVDDIFCVLINKVSGENNVLGGFGSSSIESLLDKHTKMVDRISWTDLSCKFMTQNSYELSDKKKVLGSQIAGAMVFMTTKPQPTLNTKKDDTKESQDAKFDAAFACAMNEAGLQGDPLIVNGFGGAGFIDLKDTTRVVNKIVPLSPVAADNLKGCYTIRMSQGQQEGYKGLSSDLNEIQAFTNSMMGIIHDILSRDRKFDTLEKCKK